MHMCAKERRHPKLFSIKMRVQTSNPPIHRATYLIYPLCTAKPDRPCYQLTIRLLLAIIHLGDVLLQNILLLLYRSVIFQSFS